MSPPPQHNLDGCEVTFFLSLNFYIKFHIPYQPYCVYSIRGIGRGKIHWKRAFQERESLTKDEGIELNPQSKKIPLISSLSTRYSTCTLWSWTAGWFWWFATNPCWLKHSWSAVCPIMLGQAENWHINWVVNKSLLQTNQSQQNVVSNHPVAGLEKVEDLLYSPVMREAMMRGRIMSLRSRMKSSPGYAM